MAILANKEKIMPPADSNAPTPAPVPTPEPQQPKQGFFAKLFGKKSKDVAALASNHESQTPPPQLNDAPTDNPVVIEPAVPVTPTTAPTAGVDVSAPNPFGTPEPAAPATPTVGVVEEPKPLDVPPVLDAKPVEPLQPEAPSVPPTLPTQPAADAGLPPVAPGSPAPGNEPPKNSAL